GPAYENPDSVSDADIEDYLWPLVKSEQRLDDFKRFLAAFAHRHTWAVEDKWKTLTAPTLTVWGTDDINFDVKWGRWLADAIPGTRRLVEIKGGRIFFPEERRAEFK